MRHLALAAVTSLAVMAIGAGTGPLLVGPDPVLRAQGALPRPSPFPGSSSPARPAGRQPAAAPPAADAPAPVEPPRGQPAPAGTPVYPNAEFIDSYDAGHGQRYFIYGTNAPYDDVVNYYKNTLRNGGREIYKAPATQQFELDRFDSDRMAYPPSIVVKDYTWNGSAGYLAAAGTESKRYRTVIQIVPPLLGSD